MLTPDIEWLDIQKNYLLLSDIQKNYHFANGLFRTEALTEFLSSSKSTVGEHYKIGVLTGR